MWNPIYPGVLSLVLFALGVTAFVYLLNCAIAKSWKRVSLLPALLYFSTVALIGLFGEIFLNTVYNFFVGQPLWWYNVLPIHHGYTSSYAIVAWGLYGLHLYLLHDTLGAKWSITRTRHLALIFSIEALVLEAALTLAAKAVFGEFLYYYTPGDLWHVTSFLNMPFYLICGFVILKTLKRFRKDPLFFTLMNTFLLIVLLFVTHD